MSVIPLTIIVSLFLVFTFVVFFLREQSRSRVSSPERDSMLPFGKETSDGGEALIIDFKDKQVPSKPHRHVHGDHRHGPEGACENKPDHARCGDCPSRKTKAACN